jgi:hypothetical protein
VPRGGSGAVHVLGDEEGRKVGDSATRLLNNDLSAKDVVLLILWQLERHSQLRGITRIEKLGFLISLEPEFRSLAERLSYKALHYGPYSKEIADSVDILSSYEFVKGNPVEFAVQSENRADEELIENSRDLQEYVETEDYELTPKGKRIAGILHERKMNPEQRRVFDRIVSTYGDILLKDLMRTVYEKAPEEMLAKSRIKDSMR